MAKKAVQLSQTFFKDNTVEIDFDGKKVRVFKEDVKAIQKGKKGQERKAKLAAPGTDPKASKEIEALKAKLAEAEGKNADLTKQLEDANKKDK